MGLSTKSRRRWSPGSHNSNMRHSKDRQDNAVQTLADSVCQLDIVFDRQEPCYGEGEELSGMVVVQLKESIVIERLIIEFKGSARVNWGKRPSSPKRNRVGSTAGLGTLPNPQSMSTGTSTQAAGHSEEENYFNQTLCLFNRASQESRELMVPAGSHTYPFTVVVPLQLPSTFVGDYGKVVYTAMATLERPWQPQETVTRDFHISSIVDLNTLPLHILQPMETHKRQPHGFLCLCAGDIGATWRLDRLAYVPGEAIRINGEVENNTRFKITKTKAILMQNVRYFDGWGFSLKEQKQVAMLEKGEILPGSVAFWREQMHIPPLPPTGQKCCNVMDLWYSLKIVVSMFGSSETMSSSFDIIIGTIPIDDPDDTQYSVTAFPDFYSSGLLDGNSTGSASPISGADNIALDSSYFV